MSRRFRASALLAVALALASAESFAEVAETLPMAEFARAIGKAKMPGYATQPGMRLLAAYPVWVSKQEPGFLIEVDLAGEGPNMSRRLFLYRPKLKQARLLDGMFARVHAIPDHREFFGRLAILTLYGSGAGGDESLDMAVALIDGWNVKALRSVTSESTVMGGEESSDRCRDRWYEFLVLPHSSPLEVLEFSHEMKCNRPDQASVRYRRLRLEGGRLEPVDTGLKAVGIAK